VSLAGLLTVGVPTYDGRRFLPAALSSALRLGCRVVVSDDASTDGTPDLVRERYGSRVELVTHTTNGGIGANFQWLLDACETPLLLLLNQDDVLTDDLRGLTPCVDELTILNGTEVDDEGRRRRVIYRRPPYGALALGVAAALRAENFVRSPSQVLLPVRAAREAGGFAATSAGQGAEDWLCWIRMADAGTRFRLLLRPRMQYRVHDTNASHDVDSMLASRASVRAAAGETTATHRLRLGW
jgi:glycosyltransferase involved in cell wall biosynthesis